MRTLQPQLFKETVENPIKEGLINQSDTSSVKDESDDDEIANEIKNKPVDRTKKLTRTERNLKALKKLRRDVQED